MLDVVFYISPYNFCRSCSSVYAFNLQSVKSIVDSAIMSALSALRLRGICRRRYETIYSSAHSSVMGLEYVCHSQVTYGFMSGAAYSHS